MRGENEEGTNSFPPVEEGQISLEYFPNAPASSVLVGQAGL